eukprot:gnl/MRDRNA2_/MRDRNA2_85279_c0_seq2.p1 gnl/MRDRNA2_/MRDRNA2_85279_c0~~gnl/MRDRNA2_/MRDRNA2_85279_c0_seq2.p1  ORF type:complete len:261 (-),score=27.36 gnl/MRDRNA2_/MRDRNA2_85279_c0_seq2:17-799(-)
MLIKCKKNAEKKNEELDNAYQPHQDVLHGIAPPPSKPIEPASEPPPQSALPGSSGGPIIYDIANPKAQGTPQNEPEPQPKGKGRPIGSKNKSRGPPQKTGNFPPLIPTEPKPPPAKTTTQAKPKSLNLLRPQNIPVPRGDISTTSTSSGSNGNGTTSESSSRERAKSLPPPTTSIPNNERIKINEILEMKTEEMSNTLKTMNLPSSGSRATLIGRLVEAKLGGPSAPPTEAYITAHPNFKRAPTTRRDSTPVPRGRAKPK